MIHILIHSKLKIEHHDTYTLICTFKIYLRTHPRCVVASLMGKCYINVSSSPPLKTISVSNQALLYLPLLPMLPIFQSSIIPCSF